MDNRFHGGQSVQEGEPHQTCWTRFGHQDSHEIVDCNFVLHREDLTFEPFLVVECGRFEDGCRKSENLPQEVSELPVDELSSTVGNLREDIWKI